MPQQTNDTRIRLQEWRERRGFSILELSDAAKVNRANLYEIEAGRTKAISLDVLTKLAETLRIKPSELIAP